MRLGGFIIISLRERQNRLSINKRGEYRIMCLGGSTTAIGGQYSYPAQLERILNEKSSDIRFKVINKGVESANSTFILEHLKENLDRYAPDMVITIMGENDGNGTLPYRDCWSIKLRLFIQRIRVYKLSRLLWLHIINKVQEVKDYKLEHRERNIRVNNDNSIIEPKITIDKSNGNKEVEFKKLHDDFFNYKNQRNFEENQSNFEEAEKALKKAIEIDQNNTVLSIQLGDCYFVEKKFKEAEEVLKKVIEKEPDNTYALCVMGWGYCSQMRFAEAEGVLNKAIEIDPECERAYSELASCYRIQNKYKELKELSEKIIRTGIQNVFFDSFLATSYLELGNYREAEKYYEKANKARLHYYSAGTRYNYQKLKETIFERNITLVCVQNPMRQLEALKKLFDSTEDIVFVDNERIFKDALKQGGYTDYFQDNFAGDFGHCTPEGNRLLAENIANTILTQYFANRYRK